MTITERLDKTGYWIESGVYKASVA